MTERNKRAAHSLSNSLIAGVDPIPPLNIGAMLWAVWYGKWLILWATVFIVTCAGYYAFRIASPQYAATATLQLEYPSEQIAGTQQQPIPIDTALNTNLAFVTSDVVLTDVVAKLDLLADPEVNRYLSAQSPFSLRSLRTRARHFLAGTTEHLPQRAAVQEKTVQNLRNQLTVSRQPDTYILRVTARSGDPAKAALLANTVAHSYLEQTHRRQAQSRVEAEVWLQSRVTALRKALEEQEMEIAALVATAQLQDDHGLDTLSAQVLAADQDLTEVRNALELLEIAPDSTSTRKTAEIAQMRGRISDVSALKERLSAQLSAQSAGLAQLHQLQLQTDATRQLYQIFLARLHENHMQQGLDTPNANRTAPATEGTYIGPRKTLILTIAAMLGSTIGVMLVVIRHNGRKGLIDARSLREATGLPVLAQFSTRALRQMRKRANAFPLSSSSKLLHAAHGLQTALSLTAGARPAQVIVSTSSIQSEGKSEHTLLLAHAYGHLGKRVLIIGADDRNKRLAATLTADVAKAAQANWHTAGEDARCTALGADVLLMPTLANQNVPLTKDGLSNRLKHLRGRYDYIIVDAPPVMDGPLARLLASQSDAILYAVRWSKTPRDVVERGLEALADIGCPATGLIFSKVNMRKMRKLSNDPLRMLKTTHAV